MNKDTGRVLTEDPTKAADVVYMIRWVGSAIRKPYRPKKSNGANLYITFNCTQTMPTRRSMQKHINARNAAEIYSMFRSLVVPFGLCK